MCTDNRPRDHPQIEHLPASTNINGTNSKLDAGISNVKDHTKNDEIILVLSELLIRAATVIKLQSERIAQLGGEDIKTDPGLIDAIQTEVG